MKEGRLILVRHAESKRNEAKNGRTFFRSRDELGDLAGVPDHKTPLSERGVRQARRLGAHLLDEFPIPNLISHSGYERTVATMKGALESYTEEQLRRIKIQMSHRLRERHAGFGYEMTGDEAAGFFPWLQGYWKTWKHIFATPPGGESMIDVADRVELFARDVISRFSSDPDRTEFAFAHGISIHALRFILEGWSYEEADSRWEIEKLDNCGMVIYQFNPEKGFVLEQIRSRP